MRDPARILTPIVEVVIHIQVYQRIRTTHVPNSRIARENLLNLFFHRVPPLQAAFWQRREEPVKALRVAATASAAPMAALTEPSRP
jgi:hypothetical protein